MRFVFLGSGGSCPTPERETTGLYLPDHGILLDAGTGIFALRELHGDRPLTVLMSHYHLDHSVGLNFLLPCVLPDRPVPVTVYGPPWQDRYQAAWGPESAVWPVQVQGEFHVAPAEFQVGQVTVRTRAVPHSAPVVAYRLEFPGGESLAYVTDTTAPGDYLDFVRGVDVLVHECTFSRAHAGWAVPTGHSATDAVGKLAAEAEVGELYLTHTGPLERRLTLLAEVREHFPRAVLPVDGLVYPRESSVDARRAIFPGSFDPLTVGHLDIIHTCMEMFGALDVVVSRNPLKDKTAAFTPEERVKLIRRCVPERVGVAVWEGLTVEFARQVQAGRLVRGLGRAEDYPVEVRLWKTNALLAPEIQTVWVPPRPEHLDVSSSMIKEAAAFGGWRGVAHLIPDPIRDEVGARLNRVTER